MKIKILGFMLLLMLVGTSTHKPIVKTNNLKVSVPIRLNDRTYGCKMIEIPFVVQKVAE